MFWVSEYLGNLRYHNDPKFSYYDTFDNALIFNEP